MDSNSFDQLARSFVAPVGRRRALGVLTAGGLFGLFGKQDVSALPAPAPAAQAGTCTYDLVTTTRTGPSASQLLTSDATVAGEVRGKLTFGLNQTGALQAASLVLSDGTTLQVVGQATGNSIQFRVAAGEGLVFINVGVGEQAISACQGAVDGLVTGPQVGDLGDWHAVASGGGQATATGGRVQISGATGAAAAGVARPTGPAGPSGATGPAPGAGQCPAGQANCGNGCIDIGNNVNNCGACGNVCQQGQICEGQCVTDCVSRGLTNCNEVCVDATFDVNNCGTCGNVCAPGAICDSGRCKGLIECTPQQELCSGECIDTTTDPTNCGGCGNACPDGNVCVLGQCAPSNNCQGNTVQCPNGCADLSTDVFNCGKCDIVCVDQGCVDGVCVDTGVQAPPAPPANACPGNQQDCFGECVDTSNNPNHCGGCGVPCDTGFCQSSTCVAAGPACADGQVGCRGVCVNTSNDPFNCGSCDFACNEGQTCNAGACE